MTDMTEKVTVRLYERLFELGYLLQQSECPLNPWKLDACLRAILEGEFPLGGLRETYTIKLGGATGTDEIVGVLRRAGLEVSNLITSRAFPFEAHPEEDGEIQILDPGYEFSKGEGLELLAAAGLRRPTVEEALRFAERFGTTTKGEKRHIVFLHEPYQAPDGYGRVLVVSRPPGRRTLSSTFPDSRFGTVYVLAGVRSK
jgi:hypothetical protein